MIKFIETGGPFGDATSNYEVETDAKTIGEFIDALLEGQTGDNFITICIRKPDRAYIDNVCVAKIEYGQVVRKANEYDNYRKHTIKKITGNGGWWSMGYEIIIEGEFAPQPNEEFQMVYFGWKQ